MSGSAAEAIAPQVATHVTHYVKYGRKVSDGNFGGWEAEALIAVPVPLDTPGEVLIKVLQEHYSIAESMVLEQLGREYTLNDAGVIVEVGGQAPALTPDAVTQLREAFGGGELVSDQQAQAAADNVVHVNFTPPPAHTTAAGAGDYDEATIKSLSKPEQKRWLQARLASHPHEFWDNRAEKQSERSPDFKHKALKLGVWAN